MRHHWGSFLPKIEMLPLSQRMLWPYLKPVSDLGFVLYGGTAIALRLGHRVSVDFDFFSSLSCADAMFGKAFQPSEALKTLTWFKGGDLDGLPLEVRESLIQAETGWFKERSWSYWCYRLGVTKPGDTLPPMPRRRA